MLGYISFKTRILLSFVLVLSLMISIVAYTLINNGIAKRDMGDIDNTFLPYALLAGRMGLDVVQVQQFLTDVSATHNEEGYKDAEEAARDFTQGLIKFREHQRDSAEQLRKLAEIEKDFDKFYNDGKRMAAAYIHNGLDAGNLIMEDFDQSSLALASKMNEFRDAEVANTTAHVHETTERARFASMIMWVLSAVSIVCGLGVALLLIRYLNSQLGIDPKFAKEIANEIAEGNLTRNIQLSKGDTSSLLFAMKNMQQHLLERLTRDAQEHASMLRIKMALDKASSNLMMADAEYNIIYINEALLDMFGKAQQDIRKALPGFDVTKLMGANIDIFHKNPAHQRSLLDNLQATIKSSLVIGGRHMNFIANPVFNATGERLGTVVEWADRTHEVIIENEIEAIVEAVKAGELGSRLSVADKTGFFAELSKGINELTGGIEKVFNDIASVMQSMASGDLTMTITNDYEGVYGNCKNDINATLDKLSRVFSQIKESANFIANSSQEIASGNNNLSHRAEEQAASLEETASSMEELTSTVKENAHNAQNANKVATNAGELAEKGGVVVVSAVKAMQEINESSNKIAAIIGVIDEIAFQTNLLALNASVEAARAGEHGRGFSVVATEVRNLAQRSATAARESKALIHNSIQKVRVGTEFVNETGRSLNEIVNGVKEVGTIIAEIAAASVQQSAGIEQVNMAIAQMDEITQQNAALAEEASAASVSMSEQTNNMSDLLAFFQLPYSAPSSTSATLAGKPAVSASRNTGASKIANPKKASATISESDDMWDEF